MLHQENKNLVGTRYLALQVHEDLVLRGISTVSKSNRCFLPPLVINLDVTI